MPTEGTYSPPETPRPGGFETVPDERPTFDPTALWTSVVALIAGVVQFLLFVAAFNALNQGRADRAHAAALSQGSLAAGVVALALAGFAAYRRKVPVAWPAGAAGIGVVVGIYFAFQLPETFGFLGAAGWLFFESVLLLLLVAPFVVFIVFVFTDRHVQGWALGLGILLLHAATYVVLVAYLLANLERMARRAEEANAASLAVASTVVAVVAAAWLRRRLV